MPLLFDIGVPVSARVADQVAYIRRAEELGFAGVGLGEATEAGHDMFVTMALGATQTDRITLYPAVANPVSRHPLVLANLMRSLSELAPGRTKLGLGLGSSGLVSTGLKPASLAEMRRAVLLVRERFAKSGVTSPPILIGASGPRMLALSGEVADEALMEIGADGETRRKALALVATGAASAGRAPQDVAATDYVLVSIADDPGEALKNALPWLDYFLRFGTFQVALQAHDIPLPVLGEGEAFPRSLLEHLAHLLAVVGTPARVAERFQQMEAAGAERVCCMLPGGLRTHGRALEALGRHVLPLFS